MRRSHLTEEHSPLALGQRESGMPANAGVTAKPLCTAFIDSIPLAREIYFSRYRGGRESLSTTQTETP